jgi:uncharacterized membrane protein YccC
VFWHNTGFKPEVKTKMDLIHGFTAEKMKSALVGIIIAMITIAVVLQVLAGLVPSVLTSFLCLAGIQNLYFASFYATNGVAQIILGAVILILVILLLLLLIPGGESR